MQRSRYTSAVLLWAGYAMWPLLSCCTTSFAGIHTPGQLLVPVPISYAPR